MLGIDLVEHKDFVNIKIEVIERILSDLELNRYNSITNEKRKLEYICSRFASKEAIFKAYKSGDKTLNYKDISILNKENGSPYIVLKGEPLTLEISISHTDNYSVAIVSL